MVELRSPDVGLFGNLLAVDEYLPRRNGKHPNEPMAISGHKHNKRSPRISPPNAQMQRESRPPSVAESLDQAVHRHSLSSGWQTGCAI